MSKSKNSDLVEIQNFEKVKNMTLQEATFSAKINDQESPSTNFLEDKPILKAKYKREKPKKRKRKKSKMTEIIETSDEEDIKNTINFRREALEGSNDKDKQIKDLTLAHYRLPRISEYFKEVNINTIQNDRDRSDRSHYFKFLKSFHGKTIKKK